MIPSTDLGSSQGQAEHRRELVRRTPPPLTSSMAVLVRLDPCRHARDLGFEDGHAMPRTVDVEDSCFAHLGDKSRPNACSVDEARIRRAHGALRVFRRISYRDHPRARRDGLHTVSYIPAPSLRLHSVGES